MFFKKRPADPSGTEPVANDLFEVDDVPESHRAVHGQYTVIPKSKQLYNGNWIVDIVLQEKREDGDRMYDFFGPMTEYGSADDARRSGVEHAVERLDAQSTPSPRAGANVPNRRGGRCDSGTRRKLWGAGSL